MKNKVVIITGANGNLGSSVVAALLKDNFIVIATVRAVPEPNIPQQNLEYRVLDVTDPELCQNFVEKVVKDFGKIDALICLVGGFAMSSVLDAQKEDMEKMINLNFYSAFNITQPVLAQLSRQKEAGNIVLVGAKPAIEKGAGNGVFPYAISKAMVIKMAELINADTKNLNARASVIIPSIIDTSLNRKAMPDADFDTWVSPASIAEKIRFICSDGGKDLHDTVLKIYGKA